MITSGATDVALLATGTQHLLVFVVACTTLDNGEMFKTCFVVAVAFWLVVGAVAVRRRGALARTDRLFISLGYPAMLVPCLIARRWS